MRNLFRKSKGVFIFLVLVLASLFIIFVTGDGGLVNRYTSTIDGDHPTLVDKAVLYTGYHAMVVYGYLAGYPEASEALLKVLYAPEESFILNSNFYAHHPDVQKAHKMKAEGLLYAANTCPENYYCPDKIEYRLFYAFHHVYLDRENQIAWYGPYQYTTRKGIYTPFQIGKIKFYLEVRLMNIVAPVQGGTGSFRYVID